MDLHLDAVSGVIAAFFSILIIGGSVYAVLRSSILKQNNKDLVQRVNILESSEIRNKATIQAHESKISALETVVTGRDLLGRILEIVTEIKGRTSVNSDVSASRPKTDKEI